MSATNVASAAARAVLHRRAPQVSTWQPISSSLGLCTVNKLGPVHLDWVGVANNELHNSNSIPCQHPLFFPPNLSSSSHAACTTDRPTYDRDASYGYGGHCRHPDTCSPAVSPSRAAAAVHPLPSSSQSLHRVFLPTGSLAAAARPPAAVRQYGSKATGAAAGFSYACGCKKAGQEYSAGIHGGGGGATQVSSSPRSTGPVDNSTHETIAKKSPPRGLQTTKGDQVRAHLIVRPMGVNALLTAGATSPSPCTGAMAPPTTGSARGFTASSHTATRSSAQTSDCSPSTSTTGNSPVTAPSTGTDNMRSASTTTSTTATTSIGTRGDMAGSRGRNQGGGREATGLESPLAARQARRAVAREGRAVMPQRGRFIDWARLRARGGQGGAGRVGWEPTARGRALAAIGGNGGPGGDVILRANRNTSDLYGILTVVVGGCGGSGSSGGQTGARGTDRLIDVPLGTTVRIWQVEASQGAVQGDDDDDYDEQDGVEYEDGDADEGSLEEEAGGGDVGPRRGTGPRGVRQPETPDQEPGSDDLDGSDGDADAEGAAEAAVTDPRFASPPVLEADLSYHGEKLVVARGGAGGRGNKGMPGTPKSQKRVDEAEPGFPGEEVWVHLETRLLADVGFVGLPNAGKSTLLSAITAARTKIGSYAFTTVRPQLGAIPFDDGSRLVTADIPGLVQGAHANRGRGNAFLRHIERCRCLAYVVDLSGGPVGEVPVVRQGSRAEAAPADPSAAAAAAAVQLAQEGTAKSTTQQADPTTSLPSITQPEDEEATAPAAVAAAAAAAVGTVPMGPAEQLRVLQEELRLYKPQLLEAPAIVVANKLDRCPDPRVALRALMAATPLPIVPVSAAHGVGLSRLKDALRLIVRPLPYGSCMAKT